MYSSWDKVWDRQNFLSFWAFFCPFSALTIQKIKILKLKKTPGDIIILHICNINDNHMMYGSWDKEHNRQNFLSFWTISPPYVSRKCKFRKTEKTPGGIIILHMCTINDNHIYSSREMNSDKTHDRILCHFGPFFAFLPP